MEQGILLSGGRVVTPAQVLPRGDVLLQGERIAAVSERLTLPPGGRVLDVAGKTVCPGFVDIHIHGFAGVMVGNLQASPASPTGTIKGDIQAVSRRLPQAGTTSWLPTLLGAYSYEAILAALAESASAMDEGQDGAEVLGLHMEGPFFNPAPKGPYDRWPPGGVIPKDLARRPSITELMEMIEASRGRMRVMSFSPELDGALDMIRVMVEHGVVASGAHSFASYEQTIAAVAAGMTTVTHMFNAMRHQDHREPGIIEASLVCDGITGQVISDAIHVHPPALQMAVRCKGLDNLAITTDNTPYAGMPNGPYSDLAGRPLIKTDEYVMVVDGPLFGSVMPMNRQVRTMMRSTGVSLQAAIGMATVTPARLIGVLERKGSLTAGKDADVLVLDDDLNVEMAFCKGRQALPGGEV